MNPSPQNSNHRLEILVAAYCEDRLGDQEWNELKTLLWRDAEARSYFRSVLNLHADLLGDAFSAGQSMADRELTLPFAQSEDKESKIIPYPKVWLTLAACMVFAVTLWFMLPQQTISVSIANIVGVQNQSSQITQGKDITGEQIQFESGIIALDFHSIQTHVLIEAPATFEVVDSKTLKLNRGRLTANVTHNNKNDFKVITKDSSFVDIGSSFAIDVVPNRGSELHVYDKREQNKNEALRIQASGEKQIRNLRRAAFVHQKELELLKNAWKHDKHSNWIRTLREFKQDPDLVSFLDFSQTKYLKSENLNGARPVQGRFPGTNALEFLDQNDHINFNVELKTEQLTLMAWLRLDHVDTGINSIYHTNHWQTPGQVHWMVEEGKYMRMAFHGQGKTLKTDRKWPESKKSIILDQGRWVHLASVYDAHKKSVRFYIDGEFDNEVFIKNARPALLGPAQIGNWNNQERTLNGRLDEFVIFKRCLSDEEIQHWHYAGSPYETEVALN